MKGNPSTDANHCAQSPQLSPGGLVRTLQTARSNTSPARFAIFERPVEIFRMKDSGAKVRGKYVIRGRARI
jgi:hypothetical protein